MTALPRAEYRPSGGEREDPAGMATKKKGKAKSSAGRKPAKKAAPKVARKKSPTPAAESAASPAPKGPKPLTLKQRLALIRVDPTTGKCPHGLVPDTCSFCMNI